MEIIGGHPIQTSLVDSFLMFLFPNRIIGLIYAFMMYSFYFHLYIRVQLLFVRLDLGKGFGLGR